MEKEKLIEQYMKSLGISREEALQLWEDDQNDFIGEQGEEMTKKAKEVKRYEQATEKKNRKPKERKIDEEKVEIINFIYTEMLNSGHIDFEEVIVKNEQKEIIFHIGENEYSLTLIKHRPPKK